jgi:hypothetical protein
LRFLVDQFRDYESAFLGFGPGQWFNLAMAAAGIAVLLASARKSVVPAGPPVAVVSNEAPYSRALRISVLAALILFPLCIPNSWDTEHLTAKRQRSTASLDPSAPADFAIHGARPAADISF